ncbi:ParB/RepB/Spo0J family partition protein [Miltoncostaea oceani]|uniref:ParB/RepB/Spo0J family partition protein n=1 Tax=Miltoncostaea oceani TaxID=2843216 RepID=UPI001C3E5BA2|nr:ParB/RepB/Spo0J family partition protein [Miltoncostaea oceani]
MTTETKDATTSTLAVLDIEAITTREGWNPRTHDDETEHQALTASVRAQGILQPLLVERTDVGPVLIDGHRRLAAARAAGLTAVPVIERTGDEGEAAQLAAALAANLRRSGLDPIEEARAYARATEAGWPQRRIAEAVGCSRRHVSERLRLLRLPESVTEAISDGVLTLASVPRVEAVAAVSASVAEGLVAALRDGAATSADLTERPDVVLSELAEHRPEGLVLATLPGYLDLSHLLDPEADAELSARAEAAGVSGVHLTVEDLDAARAYGCLIEFTEREDSYWRRGWVADSPWLTDRARLHIERVEDRAAEREREDAVRRAADDQARAEHAARDAEARGEDPQAAAASVAGESDGERRARERAEAAEDRRSARLANLDLGRRALLAYDEPQAITTEMARALALAALHHHQAEAARGLVLCHERLQTTETRTTKAGAMSEKVSYAEPDEAERALSEWIEGARTPEQVIGRALQALALGWFADQAALPRSERRPGVVPGRWGGGIAAGLPALAAALARPVLPERIAAQLRESHDPEALAA